MSNKISISKGYAKLLKIAQIVSMIIIFAWLAKEIYQLIKGIVHKSPVLSFFGMTFKNPFVKDGKQTSTGAKATFLANSRKNVSINTGIRGNLKG